MAGSKKGKHSKGKGKSKSKNSKQDSSQTSNRNPDGPMHPKPMTPQSIISSAVTPSTSSRCKLTENDLTKYLKVKIVGLYAAVRDWLLKSGYSMEEVEAGILNAGHIDGQTDLVNSVLTDKFSRHGQINLVNSILSNTIAFIEKKAVPEREAFKDMSDLCKATLETLVGSIMQTNPDINRCDAMWHLLARKWVLAPSNTPTSHQQHGDQNINSNLVPKFNVNGSQSRNEDTGAVVPDSAEKVQTLSNFDPSLKKVNIPKRIAPALASRLRQIVPVLAAVTQRKILPLLIEQQAIPSVTSKMIKAPDIVNSDFLASVRGTPYEACITACLGSDSDDRKSALVVELVTYIRDLEEEAKQTREWAQQTVITSARRLSSNFVELLMLREDKKESKNEIIRPDKSVFVKLLETELSVQKANEDASSITEAVSRLEMENAQIRADTEAFKLDNSESERDLKEVLKRERKCEKKIADIENQISNIRSQCEEVERRVLQLELECLQAEEEAEEAKMKWKQGIKEKESVLSLLAEETIRKANLRAELEKLQKKDKIDCQLLKDKRHQRALELARLHISAFEKKTGRKLLPESRCLEATSSEARTVKHWICMKCSVNQVSVLFLPCRHQVVCFHCCLNVGNRCPYCQVWIKDIVRVLGPRS